MEIHLVHKEMHLQTVDFPLLCYVGLSEENHRENLTVGPIKIHPIGEKEHHLKHPPSFFGVQNVSFQGCD